MLIERMKPVKEKMPPDSTWQQLVAKCFFDGVDLSAKFWYAWSFLSVNSWDAYYFQIYMVPTHQPLQYYRNEVFIFFFVNCKKI